MCLAYLKIGAAGPESYRVHQVLGESYQAQKNSEKVDQAFRAAIARKPKMSGLHYMLGDIFGG